MKSLEIIKKLVNHKFVRLTNRGNSAILHAIKVVKAYSDKKIILIPDQGGWFTYKKYPLDEGLKVREFKTNAGIVDFSDLNQYIEDCAALIISQPAGYFADQDLKHIYQKCKDKCLLIVDVTGSIGDSEICDGNFADILLGSFGEWKPVNLGYGGFISFKDEKIAKLSDKLFLKDFDETYENDLVTKLKQLKQRYQLLYKTVAIIKSELVGFDIIHKNNKGINVAVRFNNEEEKQKIITYCTKRKFPYTICPRYIRVLEDAISIEVKRL